MISLGAACADEIPGVAPPPEQVYFPTALVARPEHLLVVSSNFDQRYNAGRVHAFPMADLLAQVPAADEPVAFSETIVEDPERVSSLRIDQFGGDFVLTEVAGQTRLLIPSRGRNRLNMIDYDAAGATPADVLACGAAPEAPSRFDCQGRFVNTQAQDPFSVVVVPSVDPPQALVSHLRSERDDDEIYKQKISNVNLLGLSVYDESLPDVSPPLTPFEFRDFGGVTGITFVPAGRLGVPSSGSVLLGTLVAVERNVTPTLTLRGFVVREAASGLAVEENIAFALGDLTTAVASRGLYFDAATDRLYVSLRFQENGDSFNAGIATIDVSGPTFELLSVFEVGEELGRPELHEVAGGRRLLYVPDIRRDVIWVLDVSTDVPELVQTIEGLGERVFDGVAQQVPLLASPAGITFYDGPQRQLAFVSNFANSTIAVVDVSDSNPRKHRVVARLGRNIDAEGEQEQPRR